MSIDQSARRKAAFAACDHPFRPTHRASGQRAVVVGRQLPVMFMRVGIFMSCVAVAAVPALAHALKALIGS